MIFYALRIKETNCASSGMEMGPPWQGMSTAKLTRLAASCGS
jgi:hypothetical protein